MAQPKVNFKQNLIFFLVKVEIIFIPKECANRNIFTFADQKDLHNLVANKEVKSVWALETPKILCKL